MAVDFLSEQPPWWVAGPCIGLVAASSSRSSGRLGVLGGYSDVVDRVAGRAPALGWRAWFLVGIVAARSCFAGGGGWSAKESYGWLSRAFPGERDGVAAAPLPGR